MDIRFYTHRSKFDNNTTTFIVHVSHSQQNTQVRRLQKYTFRFSFIMLHCGKMKLGTMWARFNENKWEKVILRSKHEAHFFAETELLQGKDVIEKCKNMYIFISIGNL